MADAKVFFLTVSGDDATMAEGMRAFRAGLAALTGGGVADPAPIVSAAAPAAVSVAEAASSSMTVRRGKVAAAVQAVRRAVNKNTPGKFPCRHCDRVLGSAQGRGKHESDAHPKEFAAAKTGAATAGKPAKKYYPCGHNGCLKEFVSPEKREEHWQREH